MDKQEFKSQDLSSLINQAESALEKQGSTGMRDEKQRSLALKPALAIIAFLMIGYFGNWLWMIFAPPTQNQVVHDLEAVVAQARASVDQAKADSGSLPDALPNASLAAVVHYEPDQGTYTLVASMMGVRVTLQKDGTKSTDTGVKE